MALLIKISGQNDYKCLKYEFINISQSIIGHYIKVMRGYRILLKIRLVPCFQGNDRSIMQNSKGNVCI